MYLVCRYINIILECLNLTNIHFTQVVFVGSGYNLVDEMSRNNLWFKNV